MKKLMIAVAMTIALPAAAFAQAATAPAAKQGANADCKDMHAMMSGGGQMDHSKMDHSKMDPSKMDHSKMAANGQACHQMAKPDAKAQAADPHAGHKQ